MLREMQDGLVERLSDTTAMGGGDREAVGDTQQVDAALQSGTLVLGVGTPGRKYQQIDEDVIEEHVPVPHAARTVVLEYFPYGGPRKGRVVPRMPP
ncbi:hypothetical protein LV779_14575 [Streptomyces thinghirensis]|nr:hypothetical protein [Streptomyces thinghirensis]